MCWSPRRDGTRGTTMNDTPEPNPPRLRAQRLRLGYRGRTISEDLSADIPDGSFTVIIGPNACGKSTLLRALARLLAPESGTVLLDGKAIGSYPAKEVEIGRASCRERE